MAAEQLREQLAEMSLKSEEARAREKATHDALQSKAAGAEARAQGVEAEAAASVAKAEAALAEAKAQRDEAGLKLVKLQAKLEDLEGSAALELTVGPALTALPSLHCRALVGFGMVCAWRGARGGRAWGGPAAQSPGSGLRACVPATLRGVDGVTRVLPPPGARGDGGGERHERGGGALGRARGARDRA